MIKFEEFLKERHAGDYHGTDDAMSDAYEKWLADMDMDTLIALGDLYGLQMNLWGIKEAKEMVLQTLKNK